MQKRIKSYAVSAFLIIFAILHLLDTYVKIKDERNCNYIRLLLLYLM